ncbi:MAG: adenosylmethionine decarboxylase [Desulfurococcales archaeon]|jgi:S-adenosylmethionine decarboxylase|nr:adenosylmethionine decarboxylase [Desulfurococcales archaeon]
MGSTIVYSLTNSSHPVSAKVIGKHVYGNLYGCDPDILRNPYQLEKVVIDAARIGNMTLLDVKLWKIGEGVSIVAIVLESHISIHTWPEYGFATVDVYSCGSHTWPELSFDYIAKALKAKKVVMGTADRTMYEEF